MEKEDSIDPKSGLSLDHLCKICLLFLMGVQVTGAEIALL